MLRKNTPLLAFLLVTAAAAKLATDSPIFVGPGQRVKGVMPSREPYSAAVHFELVVDAAGPLTVETRSLEFDTQLRVSRLDPAGEPVVIGQDENSGIGSDSRLEFSAAPGAHYRLEITPTTTPICGGQFEVAVIVSSLKPHFPELDDLQESAFWDAAAARAKQDGSSECWIDLQLRRTAVLLYRGFPLEARIQAEESLRLATDSLGPRHPLRARAFELLALALDQSDDPAGNAEAKSSFENALKLRMELLGQEHPEVARSLIDLGMVLGHMRLMPESKAECQRALAIQEKRLKPGHPDFARTFECLAYAMGPDPRSVDEARSLADRALAIREAALGPDHPDVARSLDQIGEILIWRQHRLPEAKPLYQRAVTICEKRLGPEHLSTAVAIDNMSVSLGNPVEAKPLRERVLATTEKRLGPDHPSLAGSLHNYAWTLQALGYYTEAGAALERALQITRKSPRSDPDLVAHLLFTRASFLGAIGSFEEARSLYEQSLQLTIKTFGMENRDVANTMYRLGATLLRLGRSEEARRYTERSLEIAEKVASPDDFLASLPLEGLARIHQAAGSNAEARRLLEKALVIREKGGGQDVRVVLAALSALHEKMGHLDEAVTLSERALALTEASQASLQPGIARNLRDLSLLYCRVGRTREALSDALRAERIATDHVRLTARALSESLALRYASTRASGLDVALSLLALGDPAAGERAREIWEELIHSRGIVLDEMAARHLEVIHSRDPELAPLLAELTSSRGKLAGLVVQGPSGVSVEQYREIVGSARSDQERAEEALARASLRFRRDLARSRPGFEDISGSLPPDTALLAYARHRLHRPHSSTAASDPVEWYTALIMPASGGKPSAVSLGPAAEIDVRISRWRDEIVRGALATGGPPGAALVAYRAAGEALRRKIWDPVLAKLRNVRRVFVVPDGALHVVSLASLPIGSSEYLIENGPLIHYLSTERDLIRDAPGSGHKGLLALGGPDYNETSLFSSLRPQPASPSTQAPIYLAAADVYRGVRSACGDFGSLHFPPLPASELEAREISSIWSGIGAEVVHLSGGAASEMAFKTRAPGHAVIHLATHGFFLGGRCESALDSSRGIGATVVRDEADPPALKGESPLLLSGLALAGANHRAAAGPHEDDGILTAEEIAAIDLSGVEWAVLSACDTGVGEVIAGEGVFGLRRAFQVAGAGSLIMSLWPVEDESTRRWMTALYEARLVRRMATAEAVQMAGLTVLRERRARGRTTHPFFWAAFVAAGDWR